MDTESPPPNQSANPGYVAGQLARTLKTLVEHPDPKIKNNALAKLRRFEQVLSGMQDGSLAIGQKAPVKDVPPWVTLEVAHGGFATGGLLASGPLAAHEEALRLRLFPSETGQGRASLNSYYLTDQGQQELHEALRTGSYRITLPEEGALLLYTYLRGRNSGESDTAALDLLLVLAPFFDRLRFYPVPASTPNPPSSVVRLQTVAEARNALAEVKARPQIERMNDTLLYVTPLYDRTVALFLQTVFGEIPHLRKDAEGRLVHRPDNGQCYVDGGWPLRTYPASFQEDGRALLSEYAQMQKHHRLGKKANDPKENFARLRGYLERCLKDPRALTGRDVGMIRKILASFVSKHGAPDSPKRKSTRAMQERITALPTNKEYARALDARLARFPAQGGIADLEALTQPEGRLSSFPVGLVEKVARCLEAPLPELVERGVIPSAEVLAQVLPQISSQVGAAAFASPVLRTLYGAVYAAFRRRRSLLLLNLQSQVRLEELPWVAALLPYKKSSQSEKERARETLRQVAALTLSSFPESIVPNKLLTEMVALSKGSGLDLPLVEELAADIFMGTFGEKFLHAAKIAAKLLEGSVYERYYAVPGKRLLQLADLKSQWGVKVSPGFFDLCQEMASGNAPSKRSMSVAANGIVIEQEQILTTHNLAVLYQGLGLSEVLAPQLGVMAQRCLRFVFRRIQMQVPSWHARLLSIKDSGYAFRQMLFFLAVADEATRQGFATFAKESFASQSEEFRIVFEPAMAGLFQVLAGGSLPKWGHVEQPGEGHARRLLGWATSKHWLS